MAAFGVHPETGRWDPSTASQQLQSHVQNIIAKRNEDVPRSLRESGARWYEMAHDTAARMGGGNIERAAGIIAALSPMNSWEKNLIHAREVMHTGTTSGYLPANVEKAQRIHAGEDPREVLGARKASGHKVRSFFENIVDPSNPHHVTIDRHAHDIALGKPFVGSGGGARDDENIGLGSLGRYKHFTEAYNRAAGELGIEVPSRLQAETWTIHRGTAL